MSKNVEIFLRRKNKIILTEGNSELEQQYLVTFCANLESVGYTCSDRLLQRLSEYSLEDVQKINTELLTYLKEIRGAHKEFRPMYPNFPKQVMEASNLELWINSRLHYLGDWFGFRYIPNYTPIPREPLDTSKLKYEILDLGEPKEFLQIFHDLANSNSSLSETDKQDLVYCINKFTHALGEFLPDEIRQKETVALVCSTILDNRHKNTLNLSQHLEKYLKTTTDILRLVVSMSGGDISLAKPSKLKSIPRSIRKILLGLIDGMNESSAIEDMKRYSEMWKRVGEILHPGEFLKKKRFLNANRFFKAIREDEPFKTVMGRVQDYCNKKQFIKASELLKSRPGDLARKLDYLIRNESDNKGAIVSNFKSVMDKISTPVLLQLKSHFENRGMKTYLKYRVFFPKGSTSKFQAVEDSLKPTDPKLCLYIVDSIQLVLIDRFSKLEPLGKVYLDDSFRGLTVPQGMRSASKSFKTIPKLSRVDLPPGDIVRFFMWWKDGDRRTDLDLSSYMTSSDFKEIEAISYFNLRGVSGCHSGDITSAPNGACEFIDIDISKFLEKEMRYIVMSVNSYTGQKFSELKEAYAGFMMRDKLGERGEIFDARTVEQKFDLTSDSKIVIPLILDLVERKMIWLDLSLSSRLTAGSNVSNTGRSLNVLLESMISARKPLIQDLIDLHVKARGGEYCENIESSDISFSKDGKIKPWDLEKIMSDFM